MSEKAINTALEISTQLCKHFEGFSAVPYLCPANYWTIGYGTVYKPDGSKVTKAHEPITRELAEQWLVYELQHNYMASVLKKSPHLLEYPEVLGALTDFAYNLGGARYHASTLARCVNRYDWTEARAQLMLWTRGGGRVLAGLVRRRQAEAKFLPQN